VAQPREAAPQRVVVPPPAELRQVVEPQRVELRRAAEQLPVEQQRVVVPRAGAQQPAARGLRGPGWRVQPRLPPRGRLPGAGLARVPGAVS
jgi:hypothetical protein